MTQPHTNEQDEQRLFDRTALFSTVAAAAVAIAGLLIASRAQATQIRVQAVLTNADASPVPTPLASARDAAISYAKALDQQADVAQAIVATLIALLLFYALLPVLQRIGAKGSLWIGVLTLVGIVVAFALAVGLLVQVCIGFAVLWTLVTFPQRAWRFIRGKGSPHQTIAEGNPRT